MIKIEKRGSKRHQPKNSHPWKQYRNKIKTKFNGEEIKTPRISLSYPR